jgi:hypothetical protein
MDTMAMKLLETIGPFFSVVAAGRTKRRFAVQVGPTPRALHHGH